MENSLDNWIGKSDDIEISYEVYRKKDSYEIDTIQVNHNVPSTFVLPSGNFRDVVDAKWDDRVDRADRIDYLIAVSCGTIAGLIDSFFVGEFSLSKANAWGKDTINKLVIKVAKVNGFSGKDLQSAIRFLEKTFPFASDSLTAKFGGGLQHHLRDFSHHFSLGGFLCSLFTQFTGKVIGTDTAGSLIIEKLTDTSLIGKNIEEKILFGTIRWVFHLASDMAGSNQTFGNGTGIPGPIMSAIKRLSTLPIFKDKLINEVEFHTWVSKLFNGTLLAKRNASGKIIEKIPFDLRTEMGILIQTGKQLVPVIINECLVRGAYFLRRLFMWVDSHEIKSIRDFGKIKPEEVLPFNNHSIRRMVTVSSGVFCAIDMTDAAIRAAIKSGGSVAKFMKEFFVRINVAGVGRFVIACSLDFGTILEEERQKEQEFEKKIFNVKAFSLTYEQTQVLYSIQRIIVLHDAGNTSNANDKKLKKEWLKEWEQKVLEGCYVAKEHRSEFFLPDYALINKISRLGLGPWFYSVMIEAIYFKPYSNLTNDEKWKKYKKLRLKKDYIKEVFVERQTYFTEKDVREIKHEFRRASGIVTGTKKAMIITAAGTVAIACVTGGIALIFAPEIAAGLVGGEGLYGAALYSHSLAVLGGGSLAAGGLGMAGGTFVVTSGGALVGLLGGSGVSTASRLAILSNAGFIRMECCKLIAYCRAVLAKRYSDLESVKGIKEALSENYEEIKELLKKLNMYTDQDELDDSPEEDEEESDKNELSEKKQKKSIKKSLKYIRRTVKELNTIIKYEEKNA
ncbi:MAG: hypothetical protein K5879_03820 [Lachnospiraceae bacterium]|nr:hypothetical protein [Lachnospiraceae bacterium]